MTKRYRFESPVFDTFWGTPASFAEHAAVGDNDVEALSTLGEDR